MTPSSQGPLSSVLPNSAATPAKGGTQPKSESPAGGKAFGDAFAKASQAAEKPESQRPNKERPSQQNNTQARPAGTAGEGQRAKINEAEGGVAPDGGSEILEHTEGVAHDEAIVVHGLGQIHKPSNTERAGFWVQVPAVDGAPGKSTLRGLEGQAATPLLETPFAQAPFTQVAPLANALPAARLVPEPIKPGAPTSSVLTPLTTVQPGVWIEAAAAQASSASAEAESPLAGLLQPLPTKTAVIAQANPDSSLVSQNGVTPPQSATLTTLSANASQQMLTAPLEGDAGGEVLEFGKLLEGLNTESSSAKAAMLTRTESGAQVLQQAALTQANAAARATVPVEVRFGSEQWAGVMAERTAGLVMQNIHNAQIQLDPPELGPLAVKVQVQNDQASVSFVTANPAVREALDQTMTRLRDLLQEQGLELADTSVSDGSQEQAGQGDGEQSTAADGLVLDANGEVIDEQPDDTVVQMVVDDGIDDFV